MKVKMYFKDNQQISGEIRDEQVSLPVLLKEYKGYQHSLVITVNPNSQDYHQIAKARRKGNDNVNFLKLKMVLDGDPNDMFSWKIEGREYLTESMQQLFGGQWASRLEAFVRNYCTVGGLAGHYGMTNIAETYFLKDAILGNAKDCVIHLFGKGKILVDTLENVIVYMHGEYDEV